MPPLLVFSGVYVIYATAKRKYLHHKAVCSISTVYLQNSSTFVWLACLFYLNLANFDWERLQSRRLVDFLFTKPTARRLLLLQNVNLIIHTMLKLMLMLMFNCFISKFNGNTNVDYRANCLCVQIQQQKIHTRISE